MRVKMMALWMMLLITAFSGFCGNRFNATIVYDTATIQGTHYLKFRLPRASGDSLTWQAFDTATVATFIKNESDIINLSAQLVLYKDNDSICQVNERLYKQKDSLNLQSIQVLEKLETNVGSYSTLLDKTSVESSNNWKLEIAGLGTIAVLDIAILALMFHYK
jgi:hypothetical protein